MKLYRIAKQQFLEDLSGEGARLFGGRWNKLGYNMLYTSAYLSLSVLELLVHLDYKFVDDTFGFIEIEIPDSTIITKVDDGLLKRNWRSNPPQSFTQDYGTQWLQNSESLVLQVPSAVLPHETNFLINPRHKDFSKVGIVRKAVLELDSRLIH